MIIPNLTSNNVYRSTSGLFNPTANVVTVEMRLFDESSLFIGSGFSKTLGGYGYAAFDPFREAGVPFPENNYNNVGLLVTVSTEAGRVFCFGASTNNFSNDPAAHLAKKISTVHDNGSSHLQILPEAIWAPASGGGTWMSAVQLTDVTGGSQVYVYYNTASGRYGPFLLWNNTSGGARSSKFDNLLATIDGLDAGSFTYFGTVGAVEFVTQDNSHNINVTARTLNGNYSKTFPGLNLVDAETADTARAMLIQNFTSNSNYRSTGGVLQPDGGFHNRGVYAAGRQRRADRDAIQQNAGGA